MKGRILTISNPPPMTNKTGAKNNNGSSGNHDHCQNDSVEVYFRVIPMERAFRSTKFKTRRKLPPSGQKIDLTAGRSTSNKFPGRSIPSGTFPLTMLTVVLVQNVLKVPWYSFQTVDIAGKPANGNNIEIIMNDWPISSSL